jgi:hypothetical protein
MDTVTIFGLQLVTSLVAWGLIAKWIIAPWLETQTRHQALFWLTLPHISRHVGMVFLVPGVVASGLPEGFAVQAAYGDLASAGLAMIALAALRTGRSFALLIVWAFNIVGTVDLVSALSHAEAVPYLGAAWYIPTFWVPLLLVSHAMIFRQLVKRATKSVATVGADFPVVHSRG